MKSIKQQYIDLQEGNMTQANFMRNLRMTMPQYVTNLSSFEDSVKILKNKGILTEADTKGEDKISKYEKYTYTLNGKVVHPEIAFYNNILKAELDGEIYNIGQPVDDKVELNPIKGKTGMYTEGIHDRDIMSSAGMAGHVNPKHNDDAYARMVNKPIVKDIAKEMSDSEFKKLLQDFGYEEFWVGDVNATIDSLPIQALRDIAWEFMKPGSIREAKDTSSEGKWKTVTGKDLYSHFKEIDNLNGQEVLIGIDYEMEKNEELSKLEAQKIVIKNLKKNQFYYTNQDMSDVEGFEPGYIGGKSANAEARQMHPYAADKVVDKKMGMQPVKNVEKVKKDADAKKETNKIEKGVSLMSLIAKTVRGVKKMDATGEKMKKITVKENKVASTIFDKNANITKGVNKIAKGEEDKAKSVKDKLKELIRKELKEYEAGDESFNISNKEAANEIAYRLIDNLEDNTYTKSQLEDMMMSVEDEAGQHFDDSVFEKAIDILQKRGYSMIFREMFDGMEPMDRTGLD